MKKILISIMTLLVMVGMAFASFDLPTTNTNYVALPQFSNGILGQLGAVIGENFAAAPLGGTYGSTSRADITVVSNINGGQDIQGVITLCNPSSGVYSGILSMEVVTAEELQAVFTDGPRPICGKSEDQQVRFSLPAGQCDKITLKATGLPIGSYPVNVVTVDNCCTLGIACNGVPPANWGGGTTWAKTVQITKTAQQKCYWPTTGLNRQSFTVGQTRCRDSTHYMACSPTGSWEPSDATDSRFKCGTGFQCIADSCKAVLPKICEPSAEQCLYNTDKKDFYVSKCNSDGTKWVVSSTICNAKACSEPTAAAGDIRCISDIQNRCEDSKWVSLNTRCTKSSVTITSTDVGGIITATGTLCAGTGPKKGLISLEVDTPAEQAAWSLTQSLFVSTTGICGHQEDVQAYYELPDTGCNTFTLTSKGLAAGKYKASILTVTDCYKNSGETIAPFTGTDIKSQWITFATGATVKCTADGKTFTKGNIMCDSKNAGFYYTCGTATSATAVERMMCYTGTTCKIDANGLNACVKDDGTIPEEPVAETCNDGIQNQGETGKDCGGPCSTKCDNGTCSDSIKNQAEIDIDCGGSCSACVVGTCTDKVKNNGETGVDCGGSCSACETPVPPCSDGDSCVVEQCTKADEMLCAGNSLIACSGIKVGSMRDCSKFNQVCDEIVKDCVTNIPKCIIGSQAQAPCSCEKKDEIPTKITVELLSQNVFCCPDGLPRAGGCDATVNEVQAQQGQQATSDDTLFCGTEGMKTKDYCCAGTISDKICTTEQCKDVPQDLVCGKNAVTYNNACEATVAGLSEEEYGQGKCGTTSVMTYGLIGLLAIAVIIVGILMFRKKRGTSTTALTLRRR